MLCDFFCVYVPTVTAHQVSVRLHVCNFVPLFLCKLRITVVRVQSECIFETSQEENGLSAALRVDSILLNNFGLMLTLIDFAPQCVIVLAVQLVLQDS